MRLDTASSIRARRDIALSATVLIAAIIVLGTIAVRLGAEESGDFLNYHYYGGWALFHKHVGFDIAPGQLQTYHHPLLDAIYYLILRWLNPYPLVFTFLWAIPQAVAVWLSFHIALLCLDFMNRGRTAVAVIAAIIGGGGAATLGVVGISMSEGAPNAALLAAIWLILSADRVARSGQPVVRRYAGAGLLAGAAAILKLTMTPYLIGILAAIIVMKVLDPAVPRWRGLVAFGIGAAASVLVLGGPWWLAVYRAFGNPLYPYYNTIFHSPYYANSNFFDDRFLPRNLKEWLTYPLEWTLRKSTRSSELPVRDLRLTLEILAALGLAAAGLLTRLLGRRERFAQTGAAVWCAIFVFVAYIWWLKTFSILRYASALETMSGVVILSALALATSRIAPRLAWPRVATALAIAVVLVATTVVPRWERRPDPGSKLLAVDIPRVPDDSTVLLLGPWGMGYLVAFEPPSVRFIQINGNLVYPNHVSGIEPLMAQAIDSATGPLWSIAPPGPLNPSSEQSLARFSLRRSDDCRKVTSTVAPDMSLCRVERLPKG